MALAIGMLSLAVLILGAEALGRAVARRQADREWRELCRKLRIPADPK